MDSIHKLEELFTKFPGIGPRQAKRFVYYLLNKSPSYLREFTQLIDEVKRSSDECTQCHRIYFNTSYLISHSPNLCSVCSDKNRDSFILMIVARDSDFETIEKSGAYQGRYFILGGTIPILDKEPDKRIRLQMLLEHVMNHKSIHEIILSLNTTPEGEHTATIVKEALQRVLNNTTVKISLLGRGLSTGAELEYVDGDTIKNALQNRH